MTFKPTHEFRGLELIVWSGSPGDHCTYRDQDGNDYTLPKSQVTTLRPKPGEVWRFTLYGGLRIVTSDLTFIDTDGDEVGDAVDFAEGQYEKVLNADGTPA